jgi:hypothetical protein
MFGIANWLVSVTFGSCESDSRTSVSINFFKNSGIENYLVPLVSSGFSLYLPMLETLESP